MIVFKTFKCSTCGFTGWALDKLNEVTCRKCGKVVKTKYQEKEDGKVMSSFPEVDDSS